MLRRSSLDPAEGEVEQLPETLQGLSAELAERVDGRRGRCHGDLRGGR